MNRIRTWLLQLTCPHAERSWRTEPVTATITKTTGGCVRCGKWLPPGCTWCGR